MEFTFEEVDSKQVNIYNAMSGGVVKKNKAQTSDGGTILDGASQPVAR